MYTDAMKAGIIGGSGYTGVELLRLLVENSGRVLTRDVLIDRVWGTDYIGDTKTLDVHIKRLRSRIEADPSTPVLITTVLPLRRRVNTPVFQHHRPRCCAPQCEAWATASPPCKHPVVRPLLTR